MGKARAILNEGMIPVFIRVAVFHYLFGYIHPFYDGNGRLSRFITACYLGQYLHPAVALGLSALIKERQRRYYELFSLTEADINRGELTPFIMGMLELTAEAMKKTTASLQEKMTVYEKNLPYLEKLSLRQKTTQNLCDLLLQAAIFSPHGITVKEMQKYLGKTENTVYAHLKKIPAEMLLVDDRGKNYLYRLQLN
jgi:Fic family protein